MDTFRYYELVRLTNVHPANFCSSQSWGLVKSVPKVSRREQIYMLERSPETHSVSNSHWRWFRVWGFFWLFLCRSSGGNQKIPAWGRTFCQSQNQDLVVMQFDKIALVISRSAPRSSVMKHTGPVQAKYTVLIRNEKLNWWDGIQLIASAVAVWLSGLRQKTLLQILPVKWPQRAGERCWGVKHTHTHTEQCVPASRLAHWLPYFTKPTDGSVGLDNRGSKIHSNIKI